MPKPAVLVAVLALFLAADSAFAGEGDGGEALVAGPSQVLQFEIRDAVHAARDTGAWPVREYEPARAWHRAKATRVRKQYPNVMGVRFADWLAAHEAARDAGEALMVGEEVSGPTASSARPASPRTAPPGSAG